MVVLFGTIGKCHVEQSHRVVDQFLAQTQIFHLHDGSIPEPVTNVMMVKLECLIVLPILVDELKALPVRLFDLDHRRVSQSPINLVVALNQLIIKVNRDTNLSQLEDLVSFKWVDIDSTEDQSLVLFPLTCCQCVISLLKQGPVVVKHCLKRVDHHLVVSAVDMVECIPHLLVVSLSICNVFDVSDHALTRVVRCMDPQD